MEYGLDVDADSIPDWWESAPQFCDSENNCVHAVYLRHGGCGQLVGYLFGQQFELGRFRNHGLHDLEGRVERRGSFATVRYEFDGREYVRTLSQMCRTKRREKAECENLLPLNRLPLGPDIWEPTNSGPGEPTDGGPSEPTDGGPGEPTDAYP